MINIVKNILYACIVITSLGLLLCAERRPSMPPPYVEGPPPAYAPPVLAPMPPPALQPIIAPMGPPAIQPIALPIAIAPQAPPVINNIINIIHNVSQLNMESFSINRHYSQRCWLYFTMNQFQSLTRVTIYYCDRSYLYNWNFDFLKKKKKYKRIKVYQIGGYYLLKSRLPANLLDINIYSIGLL